MKTDKTNNKTILLEYLSRKIDMELELSIRHLIRFWERVKEYEAAQGDAMYHIQEKFLDHGIDPDDVEKFIHALTEIKKLRQVKP